MRWKIEHTLSYHYSRPVSLDAQTIRMKPRFDTRQQLIDYNIVFYPQPDQITHYTDIENNILTTAWFKEEYEELRITTCSDIEVNESNPYEFIIVEPSLTVLPLVYPEPEGALIGCYTSLDKNPSETLKSFIRPILLEAQNQTVPFLSGLAMTIFKSFTRAKRKSGAPWEPDKVIKTARGACRDFALLYVITCRSLGLAARFVSGYYVPYNKKNRPELHAWAEVYLPGAGWLGYDPSLGLAVTSRHITLVASYDPALTLPASGKFWGADVGSALKTEIAINPVNEV